MKVLLTLLLVAPSAMSQARLLYADAYNPAPAAPYRFLKEETGGTTPKLWVQDRAGRRWIVKWGKEVPGDAFGSRLARSLGYYVPPVHIVKRGRIVGARSARGTRADRYVDKLGRFRNARFKLVDPRFRYVKGGWRWDRNPFLNTPSRQRELNGLKLLILYVSNWDAKDSREGGGANTAIFWRGRQAIYAFDDWGASMGGWGNFFTRDKWDCDEFREQNDELIKGVSREGYLRFGFSGRHEDDLTARISRQDLRWFLGRLTRAKIAAALAATGVGPAERRCMMRALDGRWRALYAAAYDVHTASR